MAGNKVKIGFIGAGPMGQCAHLKNYIALPECKVVALAELREKRGRTVAQRYAIPRYYSSHREMLQNEKLDGIVAIQTFWYHGELLSDVLKIGLPVLIEKPLASSITVGQRLVNIAKKHGTVLMVAYMKRCDPAVRYAKNEIRRFQQTNELGKLKYIRITMPPGDWTAGAFTDFIDCEEPAPAFTMDSPDRGMDLKTFDEYKSFVNYYIHQVNLLRYLLGEPYSVTYADPSGVLLAVRSKTGIPGVIEMAPFTTTVDWMENALIAFEHGYIQIHIPAPMATHRPGTCEIFKDTGTIKIPQKIIPSLPPKSAMQQQAIEFINVVKGESSPPCGAEEALEDLQTAKEYIFLLKNNLSHSPSKL